MNTVSLDVAKELQALGWKKQTYFCWTRLHESSSYFDDNIESNNFYIEPIDISRGGFVAYAPQLHEILELLPGELENEECVYSLTVDKDEKDYMVSYDDLYGDKSIGHSEWNKNPHDAAAKLLIWCVKNNYITLYSTF